MKKKPVVTRNHTGLLLALLAVVVLIAFFPTLKNGFVNWDDPVNVYENPYVKDFTAHNIHMIFTTHVIGNYNPLPILTFAVETALFGMNPKVMHFTNLFLHILCTLLVFLLIRKLDYSERVAFIVALLFGIQPMRVESVAWITERKDVLFGLFYLASLYSYVVYLKKGKVSYLLYSLLLFIPALLSKIQAVSLPLAMLVVDYLVNRPKSIKLLLRRSPSSCYPSSPVLWGSGSCGRRNRSAVNDFISPLNRIFIAGWTLVVYLVKSVVPYEMSALYPYPADGSTAGMVLPGPADPYRGDISYLPYTETDTGRHRGILVLPGECDVRIADRRRRTGFPGRPFHLYPLHRALPGVCGWD